jgi:glycerophosphoryl diester phosphodiesterase
MKLLAHRGLWHTDAEKNTLHALARALALGHGVETDVRDFGGELVISHDPPSGSHVLRLDELLARVAATPQAGLLALNIKADGLQSALKARLAAHGVAHYFVFDMSMPDTLGWRRQGQPWAVRLSEYEDGGPLLEEARFVWLDAFERDDWYPPELVNRLLSQGKTVCVVSPELHRRPHAAAWARLQGLAGHPRLHLCTDLVEQARENFHVHSH